jgi:hypothetical protein
VVDLLLPGELDAGDSLHIGSVFVEQLGDLVLEEVFVGVPPTLKMPSVREWISVSACRSRARRARPCGRPSRR